MQPTEHPLFQIATQIAAALPAPWYPGEFARLHGVERDRLDEPLNALRLAGMIEVADWTEGKGQGYVLTDAGRQLCGDPRQLELLRRGFIPVVSSALPEAEAASEAPENSRAAVFEKSVRDNRAPVVTWTMMLLCLLVFAVGAGLAAAEPQPALSNYLNGQQSRTLLRQIGALTGEDVLVRGQWWRLLTNCFVHLGWVHLGSNMLSLFFIGPLLERLWGRWQFLLLYLLSALAGSCGMLIETPSSYGGGASGAIFGLLGSFGTWLFFNRTAVRPDLLANWRNSLINILVLNLVLTFVVPTISKGAHIGGALMGLVVGAPLDWLRFGTVPVRMLASVLLLVLPGVLLGATWRELLRARPKVMAPIEVNLFNTQLLPQIRDAENQAAEIAEEAETLMAQPAAQRTPRQIEAIQQKLDAALARTTAEAEQLDSQLFFADQVESARQASRDCLRAWSNVLTLLRRRLAGGDGWTAADEEKLAEQIERLHEAEQLWHKLLH